MSTVKERKCVNRFSYVAVKSGWIYVKQEQNDPLLVLYTSLNTCCQQNRVIFCLVIFVWLSHTFGRLKTYSSRKFIFYL